MKRWFTLFGLLMSSLLAFAANPDLIAQIKAKNATAQARHCSFSQSKHIKMMANPIDSKGTLYFENGKMTMLYDQPAGDYLVINDQQFVMQSRGKKLNHNIKVGSPMRTLRNTLIYCMQGDINAIAQECDATIEYAKEGNLHVYTLQQKKKTARGYSKVVLRFDSTTLLLQEMVLEEANGNYTEYKLGKQVADKTLNATVFQVPPRL